MRILLLVSDAFGGFGGISKFNRDFIKALSAYPNCSEVVVIPRVMPQGLETLPHNVRYVTAGLGGKWQYVQTVLKTVFRDANFQLLICGHIHLLPLACVIQKLFLRRSPLALTIFGIEAWKPVEKKFIKWAAGKVNILISISETTKKRFLNWAPAPPVSFILPCAVALNLFRPGEKNSRLCDAFGLQNKEVIMTLGRIDFAGRSKGFEEVLEAIPALKQANPDLVYLVVGEGEGRQRLYERAINLGIENDVVFTGYVKEEDKADYYRLADTYVMPSRGEGFGIVLLEAMACGIPVVGSRADGSREALRDGLLGLLVDPTNSNEIKEAVLQSLRSPKVVPKALEYFSFENFQRRTHEMLDKYFYDRAAKTENRKYRLAVLNSHPIQYFAPFYREIAKTKDIDVTVLYCSRQGLDKKFRDEGFGQEIVWDTPLLDGYKHLFLTNLGGDRGVAGFFSIVNLGIIRQLWIGQFDAILVHGHALMTYVLAIIFAKLFGVKVLIRTDTNQASEKRKKGWKTLFKKRLLSLFYSRCDGFLYVGERNREFYESLNLPRERLFFVPFAVDNNFFSSGSAQASRTLKAIKGKMSKSEELPVILFASKFIARKRAMDLLRAYKLICERGTKAELLMVGNGPEADSLKTFAAQNHLSGVQFLGFQNQSALPDFYAAADVFVLPAENEPWGLVVNEAMCAGVPVIATSEVGAAADLIQRGSTGFIYEKGDIDSLASHLEIVLNDKSLRKQMRKNCQESIKRWSFSDTIVGLRRSLEGCVARPDTRG